MCGTSTECCCGHVGRVRAVGCIGGRQGELAQNDLNVKRLCVDFFFFFNDTATTEIYTLSLHDALPIYP